MEHSYCLITFCAAWTFVVTCQVKCLTFRSRSKVKLTLGVIRWVMLTYNDPVTFWVIN